MEINFLCGILVLACVMRMDKLNRRKLKSMSRKADLEQKFWLLAARQPIDVGITRMNVF